MHYIDYILLGVIEVEEDHEAMEDGVGCENIDIVAELLTPGVHHPTHILVYDAQKHRHKVRLSQ